MKVGSSALPVGCAIARWPGATQRESEWYNYFKIMTTATQITREQHTVPQWHLKRFTDSGGVLWRYMPGKPVKKSRPKGECWEPDFYEYEVNGKTTNNKYERWLGRIENDAASRIEMLLSNRPVGLWDVTVWATYVASLFARSPKYRAQVSGTMIQKFREETASDDYVRNLQHGLLQKGELVSFESLREDTDRLREKMEKSPSYYHLVGLDRHVVSISEVLMRKAWWIVQAPPEKFFVMSDCPVTTVEVINGQASPGVGFGKEQALVFLPLTPRHVFAATSPLIRYPAIGDAKFVDSINHLTVQFAHKRVFANVGSTGIATLVDNHMGRIIFGQNAFIPANRN